MSSYSYIIKNGTIIDGSGFPRTIGDIGISGELISAIGNVDSSKATRIIDATGKYIIPGIIDITNHSDTYWTLFSNPHLESLIAQGITTILGGLCGSSLAPLSDARAIRSIQKWTDISKINVNWKTTEEFFSELERHEIAVNFATLVGHGTLRRGIAGDDARELTVGELESMKLLLRRALDEGAMGISFNFSSSHGRTATQDEVFALARTAAEADKIVSIHLRNEGRHLLQSVMEAINIARQTGARVHISHFKAIGRKAWHDFPKALALIRKARAGENLSVWVDVYPYLRTGSLLYTLLPEWIVEGGKEKILSVLKDTEQHESIVDSIKRLTLHFDQMIIAEARHDKQAPGKTIASLAEEIGQTPEETMVKLLIVNDLGITIFSKLLRSRDVSAIVKEPYSMFGSDGVGIEQRSGELTHPRSYGAAVRFLARTTATDGILSWEDAVKKMTSQPAERLGIVESRGLLKKGYFADIVVLDPATLKDTATYTKPYQYPEGIDYVFVNGKIVLEQGKFSGALAGKALRRA